MSSLLFSWCFVVCSFLSHIIIIVINVVVVVVMSLWLCCCTTINSHHHCNGMYGQLNELPLKSMSLISVSIGVLPTKRTKNNCSMTCELTVLNDGNRSNNLPNRVGWFGYCVLQYSSNAHWDFSCKLSIWATSDKPQASENIPKLKRTY